MNSQKQIIVVGTAFIIIFSILFFSVYLKYEVEYDKTKKEIIGLSKITKIHNLNLHLRELRGLSQFKNVLKDSIDNLSNPNLLESIQLLHENKIEEYFLEFLALSKKMSRDEYFNRYTHLLNLLKHKKNNVADSSYLLFEEDRKIYFLISISILSTPEAIEYIAKIRGVGTNILSKDYTNKNEKIFLLKNYLRSFKDIMKKVQYSITKIHFDQESNFKVLLLNIDNDFKNISNIVNNIHQEKVSSEEYFFETSKLVNNLSYLTIFTKKLLTKKLQERVFELKNRLFLGTTFYVLIILIIIFSMYMTFFKIQREIKASKKAHDENQFINALRDDYSQNITLEKICNISLNHLVKKFDVINGSLYIFDKENFKLYLGSAYGIKKDSLKQTLDLHENLISENILEREINIKNVQIPTNLGNVETTCTKLITIPLLKFEKSIGTIQLTIDDKFNDIDLNFLQQIVSIMTTYIYKAQIDDESSKYLKLIDKNVLISKTDLDGNIIEISEQLCILSGFSKKDLIGKNHRIMKSSRMSDEFFTNMWDTLSKGQIWSGDIQNAKKNGDYYWVDTTISPDCDLNGNIIGYTAIKRDITDRKTIEKIAITDGLTSLFNRRHFDTIFSQQIKIACRANSLLCFVLLDIDFFKQYNDTYGHQDGDIALKRVALALKQVIKRPNDYVFRLGGEEFGMLYNVKNKKDAFTIAENTRKYIENLEIEHLQNTASKYLTISAGIYIIKPNDILSENQIYKKCDDALYQAKQYGKNQISIII
ncbi:MAG: diguanylate cyclase [Sulfurimonas sp.]|nr:diguanylate cyclase [Sulfurimonas sp.]